jgi:hypothetical protein
VIVVLHIRPPNAFVVQWGFFSEEDSMRRRLVTMMFVAVLAVVLPPAHPAAAGPATPPEIEDTLLPFCWGIRSTYGASESDLERMSKQMGTKLVSVDNVKINAAGIPLQVNVMVCPTEAGAKATYRHFVENGHPQDKFVVAGDRVYEFMCENRWVAAKMKDLLGLLEKPVRRWRVRMEVAPIDRSHDDMKWNDLYNAAVANRFNPDDQDAVSKILDLTPSFDFGSTLMLRMEQPQWGAPEYAFTPEPKNQSVVRDFLKVTFEDLPVVVNVPRVTIEAVVPTRSFANYKPEKVDKYACVRTTDPWPMARREVAMAITDCASPDWDQRLNVQSILCWVYHNIEYRGDKVGSRYGIAQTLTQKYGHCWDKTDVFISMCRLLEYPARQVFGWLEGQGGHVWAQVYFDDEGWVSIDPTCSWMGVTDDYIPLFITEDGHPPFVYTAVPEISAIDSSDQ